MASAATKGLTELPQQFGMPSNLVIGSAAFNDG